MTVSKKVLSGAAAAALLLNTSMSCGLTAIAENSIIDESRFVVDVPDSWTNNCINWVTASDGVEVYYKVNRNNQWNWGNYTDPDAKRWDPEAGLEETNDSGSYIRFWGVKNGEVIDKYNGSYLFRYDKTPPADFQPMMDGDGYDPYKVKNRSEVRDDLSGIKAVYYSVQPYSSIDEILGNAKSADYELNGRKCDFSFSCTPEMNGSEVYVYAVDRANNIKTSTIKVESYIDRSMPKLVADGFDENVWVNDEGRKNNWKVSTSQRAKIYYKTADEDLGTEWGSCDDASLWNDNVQLPEGEKYIHFWASYDHPDKEIAEATRAYKYDRSAPDLVFEDMKMVPGDFFNSEYLNISSKILTDEHSGVRSARLKIKNNGFPDYDNEIFEEFVTRDSAGNITGFSMNLNEMLKGAVISVIVTDGAGNSREYSPNNKEPLNFDPQTPFIDESSVKILTKDKTDAAPHTYGSAKLKNKLNGIYANENGYLYLKVSDNDLRAVRITVNGTGSMEFTEDAIKRNGGTWENEKGEYSICIKLSSLADILSSSSVNAITIEALDHKADHISNKAGIKIGNVSYSVIYDPYDDKDAVITPGTSEKPENVNKSDYFGEDYSSNTVKFDISDDNGLKNYSVKVNGTKIASTDVSAGTETTGTYTVTSVEKNEDGEDVNVTKTLTEKYKMPVKKTIYSISLGGTEYDFSKDGKYNIEIAAEDLAGNTGNNGYSFIIDKTPPVIEACEYKYKASLIRYLSFGLFGSESYTIRVRANDPSAEDGSSGIGIESVVLNWADQTFEGKYDPSSGMYEFAALPVGNKDIPSIVVTDKLGNSASYCMVSSDSSDENNEKKANIHLKKGKGTIELVLEDTLPVSEVIPSTSFTMPEGETDTLKVYKQIVKDENGQHIEWWYPNDTEYTVTAFDADSGLYSVNVMQNDKSIAEETEYDGVPFRDQQFSKEKAEYSYPLTEEGSYKIFVYAEDNARNTDKEAYLPEQSAVISLDKTKPQISEFRFGEDTDKGQTVERMTYGFFFTDDTEVRIFAEDGGISSGIESITLNLDYLNGEKLPPETRYADEFRTEEETGRKYAAFTIRKGYKGKVSAIVTDNVGHSSGLIYADGNIIEDPAKHEEVCSIEIRENNETQRRDANDLPLYNDSIPLTVSVVDTFSGISRIEWEIADDNKSGIIDIDIDGNYRNIEGEAGIIEDSVERDSNLITAIKFGIVVESDTNGNVVTVRMTDRSGNKSEETAAFSIDRTPPVISAELSGGGNSNGYYYNQDQVVTISIQERNFDPAGVSVRMNGSDQAVSWSGGASVTSDETVHTGSFRIGADGTYSFTVSYTDMAGNSGTPYSQSTFIIDKTAPVITNNFSSFGVKGDENIYFNLSQKDKAKAEITVVETNFNSNDMNITVSYQPAGSTHSNANASWSNYYYKNDWRDDGSGKHSLTIPFTEDGVYKISMASADRAGNAGIFADGEKETAVFEADYTPPVIYSRNGSRVEDTDVAFYDLYDFERRNDDAPTVMFKDTNIDRIKCEGQKYTPVYSNGREIGSIKAEDISSVSKEIAADTGGSQMIFTLDNFTRDGVYSAKLTAYDKAGNKSTANDNTYVRMVDPTVKVLAYIENSSRETSEGWYSFEDDNGPISKQPGSFTDLSIVVFSRASSDTRICLVDKKTSDSSDTHITDEKEKALFDSKMYGIGAYRYTLSGEYFENTYTADDDRSLYLRVVNSGAELDLGEIYIDNTDPNCSIPEHFKDWGWFSGSGNHILTFDDITEILDIEKTLAYIDGETIKLSNVAGNEDSPFTYDETERRLTLEIVPGSHKVGLLLVDRAGNTKSITEVQHLAIGNYRIWIGVGAGVGTILLAIAAVFITKKVRSKRPL